MKSITFLIFLFTSLTCIAQESTEKFKVGIVIPLSGSVSEFGVAIKNGYELALKDNTKDALRCEFTIEDSEYNSTKAVTIFHELTSKGTNLIYTFGGPMGEVLAPLAEVKKTPLFVDGINPTTTKDRKYVVRLTNPANEYADKMVDYLKHKNTNRIVLVKTDNQYLDSLASGMERRKNEFEYFETINLPVGEFDFKTILPKLLRNNLNAIGLFLLPGQSSSLAKLLKSKRDQFILFGTNFMASKSELEASQGTLEGALYPSNFVTDDFKAKYLTKTNNDSAIKFAGESYDAISLIIKEICAKLEKPSNDKAMEIIKNKKTRSGALGETTYTEDENGDKYFRPPVFIMKVSKDGYSPITF